MRHSKFFLLDQEPKYKNLSENEFIKESTSYGHLLGSHAILSPQSRPSSPVNTQLQPLAAGNVLRHLQCFGQKLQVSAPWAPPGGLCLAGAGRHWVSWGTYLQPFWPQLAWLPRTALQGKKTAHTVSVKLFASPHLLVCFSASDILSCSLQLLKGQMPSILP